MEALSLVNKLHILCRVNDAPLSRFNDPPGSFECSKSSADKVKIHEQSIVYYAGSCVSVCAL